MNVFKWVCLYLLVFVFFTVSYSNLLEDSLYFEGKGAYARCVPDKNWN